MKPLDSFHRLTLLTVIVQSSNRKVKAKKRRIHMLPRFSLPLLINVYIYISHCTHTHAYEQLKLSQQLFKRKKKSFSNKHLFIVDFQSIEIDGILNKHVVIWTRVLVNEDKWHAKNKHIRLSLVLNKCTNANKWVNTNRIKKKIISIVIIIIIIIIRFFFHHHLWNKTYVDERLINIMT
jgi:hypothetical protein